MIKKFIITIFTVLTLTAVLCACTPNGATLQKKLESIDDNKKYSVSLLTPEDYRSLVSDIIGNDEISGEYVNPDKLKLSYILMITAKKNGDKGTVLAFKKGSDATKFYNSLKDRKNATYDVIKKGSAVIFGPKTVVEDVL